MHNYFHPVNQTLRIEELRDFAESQAGETTTIVPSGYSKEGLSKEGKAIPPTPLSVEQRTMQRWGIWGGFDYFGNGRNLYQGSFGFDYRVLPHWIVGADMRLGYVNANAGLSVAQGGLYTAFYEKGFWGVLGGLAGPNLYTIYIGTGYDFRFGSLVIGPVGNFQWDDATFNQGLGRGQVEQARVGGRIGYTAYRIQPWAQVMWQYQTGSNNDPLRRSAAWAGVGVNVLLSQSLTLWAGYAFEGNGSYQLNQGDIGLRYQF